MFNHSDLAYTVWLVESLNAVGIFGEKDVTKAIYDIYNTKVPSSNKSINDNMLEVVSNYAKENPYALGDFNYYEYMVINDAGNGIHVGKDKHLASKIHAETPGSKLYGAFSEVGKRVLISPTANIFTTEETARKYLTRKFIAEGVITMADVAKRKSELLNLIPPSRRSEYHPNDTIALAQFYSTQE